jgi:general secretion pathway protein G
MFPTVRLNQALSPSRPSRRGFTVLEILIVLAVIGMLVALGVSQADRILGRSSESVARIYVNETLRAPLVSYRIDMGSYPSTQEGLQALVAAPANRADRWRGPYVDRLQPDPWGNPYQYRFPGTRNPGGYDLFSFGPSGREGDDDIGNW